MNRNIKKDKTFKVFKTKKCDICNKETNNLTKVSSKWFCQECLNKKYPIFEGVWEDV